MKIFFWVILLICSGGGATPFVYAVEPGPPPGWVQATVEGEAPYRREPQAASEILGYLTQGSEIIVSSEPENEFYKIYFPAALMGSEYAWVAADKIKRSQLESPSAELSLSIPGKGFTWESLYPSYFLFAGTVTGMNPTAVQSQLGESPNSILSAGATGEFGMRLFSRVDWNFQIRTFSFKKSVQGYDSSVSYALNGVSALMGLQFRLYRRGPFAVFAGLGGGFSLSSAGNRSVFFDVNTNSLTGYPVYGQARFRYLLGRIGLNFDLGYLVHVIHSIPFVNLPIGDTQSTANLDASGFYGTLGVSLHF